MKRWMVRLAAISTVVLAGLVLFAHAYRGSDKDTALQSEGEADKRPESNLKPIPLTAEASSDADATNPFKRRSRLTESTEQAEPMQARYTEDRYTEQTPETPANTAEEARLPEEPRKLNPPDDASEIPASPSATRYALLSGQKPADDPEQPAPRNPFGGRTMMPPDESEKIERVASDEPIESSTAEAAPSEQLTSEVAEESTIPSEPLQGGRYGQPAKVPPAVTDYRAPSTELATNAASAPTGDTSAFSPPSNRSGRSGSQPAGGRPGDRKLEGSQAPSLAIEKTAPAEIQVGKPATFLIHVRNVGQVTANEVQIHDEIPQGAELVSTKPTAQQTDDGKLVWQLGTLKAGGEMTVEMQITPTTEGEIGSVASVTFKTQASARTRATRPQLKLEASAPPKVLIGETAMLRIRISNPGTGVATGVTVNEEVPAGFKHEGGKELEFEVGTLAPGESRELELALVATQPGVVTNTLHVRGDANLHVEDRDEIEVIAPALKVGLQGPKRRYLQRNATYNLSVTNPGTATAKNVELVVTLPRGLKFVETNNEGQYDATSHTVIWSLSELPPNESGTVTLNTLAVEAGELKIQVNGKAAMNLSDSLEEDVVVEGMAAIFFELVDVNDPIEVGGETSYEIRVINQGSAAATNVRLVALLPAEMKAIDAEGPVQHTIEQGRVLFEPLGQLAPKADTTYTVKVQGQAAGDLRLRVQVMTDQITNPITKEESTRVYSDE